MALPAAVLLVLLLWLFVQPSNPTEKKDFVQAVGVLLAALAALGGLYFTWQGQKLTRENTEKQLQQVRESTEKQLQQARESQERTQASAQETLRLTEQGQITERFTRAIDQLGSKELEVRLGGIYALERIAWDSERDHWTIMEILTAYVREHAPRQTSDDNSEGSTYEELPIDPDIQAIITVIRRRNPSFSEPEPIDLHLTKLHKARLQGANLRGANLWRVDFSIASLSGAYLEDADLGGAVLSEAQLGGAYLRGADLREARLVGANLSGADLQFADLRGTDLSGAKIYVAQLQGADLRHLREGEPRAGYVGGITAEALPPPGPLLSETTGLTQAYLSLAQGDEYTELPSDIEPPAHWVSVKTDEQVEKD